MKAMKVLGVPYTEEAIANSLADATKQAEEITKDLEANQVEVAADSEIIAMIAYLQRLGKDIKAEASSSEAGQE